MVPSSAAEPEQDSASEHSKQVARDVPERTGPETAEIVVAVRMTL